MTDPKRRRGAQPGNLNALKHGFYSKQASPASALDTPLSDLTEEGLTPEIVILHRLILHLSSIPPESLTARESIDLSRAVCQNATAIARLLRTQRHLNSGRDEFTRSLHQALTEIQHELDLGKPLSQQTNPSPFQGEAG